MTANDWILVSLIGALGAIPVGIIVYQGVKEWFIHLQENNKPEIDFDEYKNTLDRLEYLEIEFAVYKDKQAEDHEKVLAGIGKNFIEAEERLNNLDTGIKIAERNDEKIIVYVNKLEQTYDMNFKIIEEKQRLIMDI